jgi:ribA/ribD-fused uncharacterized protein
MLTLVRAKFAQHSDLKRLLLEAGDCPLAEASPFDSFWGIGKTGTGANKLGKILMQVRAVN